VPDDVLRRVRDTGGIVMVTFVPSFLTEAARPWLSQLIAAEARLATSHPPDSPEFHRARDAWVAAHPCPPTGVSDVADHIEHIRTVAGVDHVGLGGDYDGVAALPDGLGGVDGYPALLRELAERGWRDADLAKLTWHNAVRVLRATEAVAG
jgi:membrane dipeptidase